MKMILYRILVLLFFWNLYSPGLRAQPPSPPEKAVPPDTTAREELEPVVAKGVLTTVEYWEYRSDFFPINLTQRGRFATTAWRGMPPGLYAYKYAGLRLQNPVTGFWNEQWIPYYQTKRPVPLSALPESHLQPPVPPGTKPVSRIIFSQDYVIGLSFLDINFTQKFGKNNYFQLSGSNFLSDGTERLAGGAGSDFSTLKITTYRAQLHWEWSERWRADFFFWQMRHRFHMLPESGSVRDKFKQVGNFFWARLQARLSSRDSLVLVPAYWTVEDKYTRAFDEQRDIRYKLPSLELRYSHSAGAVQFGVWGLGRYIRNRGEHHWTKSDETAAEGAAFLQKPDGSWQFLAEAGVFWHNAVDAGGRGRLQLSRKVGQKGALRVSLFVQPTAPPLLWRAVRHDTIPPYAATVPIITRGGSAAVEIQPAHWFWLHLEPFFTRTRNYPVLPTGGSQWSTRSFQSQGINGTIGLKLWRFWLENAFTYHAKPTESFAPRLKNVTTLKTSLSLFNRALRLDGIVSWRYFDDFHLLEFDRLLYQYRLTPSTGGRFGIGDARIQAAFRDATLFFIWENFTSTDYFFVNNTLEDLLIFRLGVDWTLFN